MMKKYLLCIAACCVALILGGCATATGPVFGGPLPTPADKADVYLYRGKAFFAMGAAFEVQVDGKEAARLANASYAVFRMAPGLHLMKVNPGPMTKTSFVTVEAVAGERRYYEYDFVTGPLANTLFIGSSIESRAPENAVQDMVGLNNVSDKPIEITTTEKDARVAAMDMKKPPRNAKDIREKERLHDAEAVPLLNAKDKEAYKDWLTRIKPRAFVISSDGHWSASWGRDTPDPSASKNPAERALNNCQKKGFKDCRLYAVDDKVVWDEKR